MDIKPPVYVLSIDGGGVRGLSALLILESLLEQVQTSEKLDTLPLPCEVFDLICGTSTGGLIALMLGRLRMDIKQAIECYLEFSQTIFGRKESFWCLRRLMGRPIYDAAVLEQCARDIVTKHTPEGEDDDSEGNLPLKDPLDGDDRLCRTFVVAVTASYADAPPKLFRTYKTRTYPADKCKIWEAARATTAATTFFDPITVDWQMFIDGAFSGANNPSQLALSEIEREFPDRQIGCFLSLGTGVGEIVALKGSLVTVARACAKLLTSCEGVDNDVRREFDRKTPEGQENPYFRFSATRGMEKITLDEWNRREELVAFTMGYLNFEEQKTKAGRCVEILKERMLKAREAVEQCEVVAALT